MFCGGQVVKFRDLGVESVSELKISGTQWVGLRDKQWESIKKRDWMTDGNIE